MDAKDVGAWVAAARRSKGLTQEGLGDAMGVTKANVSHWETAKHDPSFLQLLRIRDITGYPLREVMAPADWPLPGIPKEKIAALPPDSQKALQAGIIGMMQVMLAQQASAATKAPASVLPTKNAA